MSSINAKHARDLDYFKRSGVHVKALDDKTYDNYCVPLLSG